MRLALLPPNQTMTKAFATLLVVIASLATLLILGTGPEVFLFAKDGRTAQTIPHVALPPIHLADDVMISLRAGLIAHETGIPSLNREVLSQPSTSYLVPYLFALLLMFFEPSTAVAVYASLSLGAGVATLVIIFNVLVSQNIFTGVIALLPLILNKTFVRFTMTGWDHVFAAFFLAAALRTALAQKTDAKRWFAVGAFAAVGAAFRPDVLPIALAVAVMPLIQEQRAGNSTNATSLPLIVLLALLALLFVINYRQFGWVLPTTFRLKFGAAPDAGYATRYVVENTILFVTAATAVWISSAVCMWGIFRGSDFRWRGALIIAGCFVTVVGATFNSDVFPGARMYWAPAVVLWMVMARIVLGIDGQDRAVFARAVRAARKGIHATLASYKRGTVGEKAMIFSVGGVMIVALCGTLAAAAVRNVQDFGVRMEDVIRSRTARQYVLVDWINERLDTAEGAIGLFFLGMAFHLQKFQVADFLGKGDEFIARLPVKWGPPGHNKWDIELSVELWKPQVIIPPGPLRVDEAAMREAVVAISKRKPFAFEAALVTSDKVRKEYLPCFLGERRFGVEDSWGMLVRRDIQQKWANSLVCSEWGGWRAEALGIVGRAS